MVAASDLFNANWVRRLALPLRAAHPRAYAALNGVRKRILTGREGVDAYQANAVRRFAALMPLQGARVLEIGSDPRLSVLEAIRRRGAREAVGINNSPAIWDGREGDRVLSGSAGVSLRDADAVALPFDDRSFDGVFSVAVFEHLRDLPASLAEIHRVLRPGGTLYTSFGPIWSAGKGHHVRAEAGGEIARHAIPEKNPLPDFVHLLLDEGQLRHGLAGRVPPPLSEAIVRWVFSSPEINRLFHHQYLEAFRASPLDLASLRPERDPVPPALQRVLAMRWPRERDFDVTNTEAVLLRR